MKNTSTRGRKYGEQCDDSRRLTRTRSAAFALHAARAASGNAAAPPSSVMKSRTIPIVFVAGADPVKIGLVAIPVISKLEERGLELSALHNHLMHETPRVVFMAALAFKGIICDDISEFAASRRCR